MNLFEELEHVYQAAQSALEATEDAAALEAWYAETLGRKGTITLQVRSVGQLPAEERPAFGKRVNEIKQALEAAYTARAELVKHAELTRELEAGAIDVTLPGRPMTPGHLHLTTQTLRKIYSIFGRMGFEVYEAPDVELESYNFDLLNIPEYHPARDMWDTFWVQQQVRDSPTRLLLRTHTSPGQIRVMRERYPEPIRVILPGKCYRYEQITARSEHQFYQVEGLAVGKSITMTDLIGTLTQFTTMFYGPGHKMRVRSSYFPFTEPSIEVDMDCILCGGKGCRVCKYTGWLEIAGAGMVHPVVLKNGGYDPHEWSGFAFGPGVERPAMLKYNVNDIRYFYGNDLRFLQQF
ncbi:MAG TPA: phenylalanine--tRNA ligase subunit alpha [Anaerolineae bacterium]|nr:phenylalanine--tRNA ligase subunit alpha [Anaerolineae bacterium]HQH38218.1 phenylalanine--tRNA ligase subunit alpha [Anaerolineae bacterium]